MSILARFRAWLGRFATPSPICDPGNFALRDWADLPTHHPARDSQSC